MTSGEMLCERWLQERAYAFERHPDFDGAHPDYLVHGPSGDVVIEVIDPEYAVANRVGTQSFDSAEPVRRAIKRKARQGRGVASAELPYVLVVHSTATTSAFGYEQLAAAMNGLIGVAWAADGAGNAYPIFGEGARMQSSLNARFSALASIRLFNPTQGVLDWQIEKLKREEPADVAMFAAPEIREQLISVGDYVPDATAVRLLVCHNVHGRHRVGPEFFAGPHDDQHAEVEIKGIRGLGRIASGVRWNELDPPDARLLPR